MINKMGVKSCQVHSCQNIMCDKILLDSYICDDCLFLLEKEDINNSQDLIKFIDDIATGAKELRSSNFIKEWLNNNIKTES